MDPESTEHLKHALARNLSWLNNKSLKVQVEIIRRVADVLSPLENIADDLIPVKYRVPSARVKKSKR